MTTLTDDAATSLGLPVPGSLWCGYEFSLCTETAPLSIERVVQVVNIGRLRGPRTIIYYVETWPHPRKTPASQVVERFLLIFRPMHGQMAGQ